MRTNEWHDTSIAFAKPAAEQLSSPPCRSSFGAKAIECTRMSSRPHWRGDRIEYRFELAVHAHVERQEDRRLQRTRVRLDERSRLLVQIRDGNIRAELAESLGAAIRNGVLVGDADDQCLGALQHRAGNFHRHDRIPFKVRRAARRVCRAIISSSLVGMTHAETRLPAVLMRGPLRSLAARVELHAEPRRIPADPLAQARLFSPMPAVNTIASSPPSAAASDPSSRPIR